MTAQNLKYLAVAACAVVAVAAFLTWVKDDFGNSVTGISDGRDGVITLPLALIGAVAFWFYAAKPWVVWLAIIAAAVAAIIGVVDVLDTNDKELTVGIGLWLTVLGGATAAVAGVMLALSRRTAVADQI